MDRISQLRRMGLFDARVPRYTSYPTAPQFSAMDGDVASDWIRAVPEGADLSVYVHIPFCRRLCRFCACRTQGTATSRPVAGYLETLKREIELVRGKLPTGASLGHLHWGGGTPTLLEPAMIAGLAKAIRGMAPLAAGGQFSVEIDPTELDGARLDALAAAGMTRASIGVQDFDPAIQETIGRVQGYEVTRAAAEGLRARGIGSLNADMLYGLPHQTPARIAESMQMLLSLNPDRVALFGYAHVPWMAKRQRLIPEAALPGPEARLELYETARRLLVWDGYVEIGIDHFARPGDSLARAAREGRLRRNFQGYTEDRAETLIGLGASSISRFAQGYAQNAPATAAYQAAVRGGRLATVRGHAFTADDRLRGAIIEALMCRFEADLRAIAEAEGRDPRAAEALADGLEAAFPGQVRVAGGTVAILPDARPLTRMIAAHFDAYAMSPAGHSPAI